MTRTMPEECKSGCPPALDQGPDRERRLDIRGQFISRFLWSKDMEELRSWGAKVNTFKDQLSMYDMEDLKSYYEATAAEIRLEKAMGIKFGDVYGKKDDGGLLAASDVPDGKEIKVTVKELDTITFPPRDDRPEETKILMTFVGKDKGMALNKTNAGRMTDTFGDDTDNWVGQEIVIYKESTEFGGKPTMGLRLRVPGQVEDTPF